MKEVRNVVYGVDSMSYSVGGVRRDIFWAPPFKSQEDMHSHNAIKKETSR